MAAMNHGINLYERKIIKDDEFPVQIFEDNIPKPKKYCCQHWHEHIEMHYILKGKATFYCNYIPIDVKEGDLIIVNSNELHEAASTSPSLKSLVVIFEISDFSKEAANCNMIFQTVISKDEKIKEFVTAIFNEAKEMDIGYKVAMRGKIYELITYLMRNYVVESITDKENRNRIKNLSRLNTVFQFIQNNYTEPLTNKQLAEIVHLSEYRFCHLFKESIGQSPLNFINEVRLKKAHHLLQNSQMSITQISSEVGFRDFNNFGRLFRKYYGYAPSTVWKVKERE